MDVVICLQRLLRCYLLLLPKVINKDRESQVKKIPVLQALEIRPHPQTNLCHYLTLPFAFFQSVDSSFAVLMAKEM